MRNWNPNLGKGIPPANIVYRVPMRNWNGIHHVPFRNPSCSLSRTYEELKLRIIVNFMYFFNQVYRVPMRNWNKYKWIILLVYLFSLSRTYEELKPINKELLQLKPKRLSRTYEELKLKFCISIRVVFPRLSRTYEEL